MWAAEGVFQDKSSPMPPVRSAIISLRIRDVAVNEPTQRTWFAAPDPAEYELVEKFRVTRDRWALFDKPAPNFERETMAGETISLGSLRGKVVVLVVWRISDLNIREWLTMLQQMQASREDNIAVIGLVQAGSEDEQKIRDFLSHKEIVFPNVLDEESRILRAFGSSIVIIDQDGRVREQLGGYRTPRAAWDAVSRVVYPLINGESFESTRDRILKRAKPSASQPATQPSTP